MSGRNLEGGASAVEVGTTPGEQRRRSARISLDGFVESMVRVGVDRLVDRFGAPVEVAAQVMRGVAYQLCADYAARHIYVPKGYDPRNRVIVEKFGRQGRTAAAFTAARIQELADEFQLTERRIYGILAEGRKSGSVFPDGAPCTASSGRGAAP